MLFAYSAGAERYHGTFCMDSGNNTVYHFEGFDLDSGRRLLMRDSEIVALSPKAFDILLYLVQRRGELVSKDELMKQVWPDSFVEENNLTVNMTLVRRALGEKRGENRFVVTVPGRGYLFAAPISLNGTETAVTEPNIASVTTASAAELTTSTPFPHRRSLILVLGVLVLAALAIGAWWFFRRPVSTPPANQIRTLAVLPFRPLAPNEQDAILGVGMADALIAKLSDLRRVTVRPTSAIAKYTAGNTDLLAAGRELNVDAVLDGKLQRSGDVLRITVQLVRVSDNAPLWASTFDTKETDLFALQDSISAQVADSLAFRLNDDERQRIARHSTDDPEAYKLYLNGLYQLNKRTLQSAERAREYFDQAIQRQPNYAAAWAGLGDTYMILGNQEALLGSRSPLEYIPKSKAALQKALSLDASLAEAHATMAWVSIWETGEITVSQEDLRKALAQNPELANAHHYNGLLLMIRGRFDEALSEMRKAQAIDQFSLIYNLNIATVLFRTKRYDEAEVQCRKTMELDPNFARAHWLLGLIYEQRGKYTEAIASLRRAVELSGNGTLARASLAHALAKSGVRPEAEKLLAELIARRREQYVAPDYLAMIAGALGEKERAFQFLEEGLIDRPFSIFQLGIEQRFDDLRVDPRFAAVETRTRAPRSVP